MVKHKVYVKRQRQGLGERSITSLCRRAIKATLQEEGITSPVEISVLVSDDKGIQEMNKEHRNIDAATDVLSFPTQAYIPGDFKVGEGDIDPDTGILHLGDIVISCERAENQAKEYGHETTREIAYLMVHSTLHLLGYDHENPRDKSQMRAREDHVLATLGLGR